ncbi:MAG: tetratricopeptide repeat protein [Pseudomonadota bacterium]
MDGREERSKTGKAGNDAPGDAASVFHAFPSPLAAILLILVAGTLVYANSFRVPFMFSDIQSIPENQVIRNLENFYANSAGYDFNSRRVVGYLTLALNYHFGGLEVAGYHLFNLAIHLFSALLVYVLMLLSFRTPHLRESRLAPRAGLTALLAALVFVVHPVQTMAVTFVVQRLTSLTTLFYLLAMVLYIAARLKTEGERFRTGEWKTPVLLIGASVISAVLAMKTKEIAFTLPLAIALYELYFFQGEWKRRFLSLLPLLLTLPIVPLSIIWSPDAMVAQGRVQTEMARLDYLFTQFRVIVTYLRLLVFPVNQNLDYDYPVYTSFLTPPVFISFLFLTSLFALAVYLYFRSGRPQSSALSRQPAVSPFDPSLRLISFGILWFFLALSVESSLIPIVDVIFEYRLYLPSVGAIIAAAVAFGLLLDRVRNQNLVKALMIGAAVVLLIFGAATWKRNIVWQSHLNMWQDVAAKSPNKARPQVNLGAALGGQGRMAEAVAALSTAVRLEPDNPDPYVNLGAALASQGRLAEAIPVLSRAVALEPANADAGNNLGLALILAGRQDEAIPILAEAVRLDPDFERAWYNLGHAYFLAGRNSEAIGALKRALDIFPDYGKALVLLAEVLNREKQYQETMNLLSVRLQAFANWPDIRRVLGMAAHCLGDNSTASRELAALQQLDYQQARQLSDLMAYPCQP